MPRPEDPPSATPVRLGISAHRKLYIGLAMLGITAAAATLFGCGGETTGDGVTMNGSGVTGGVQGTAGSTGTGGSSGCPGTGGPTMVRLPEGYCIDSTEVTRAQYQAWLDTNPSTAGQISDCTRNGRFVPDVTCMISSFVCQSGCDNHPQVCVDWCDAYAYCQAVGKRLCGKIGGGPNGYNDYANASLSQWYNACGSDGVNNAFPYGSTYQPDYCNGFDFAVSGSAYYMAAVPVGSMPSCQSSVSGYQGVYDLSGNVMEWEDSCDGSYCHLRGGSFNTIPAGYLACGILQPGESLGADGYVGFRCCS